MKKKCDISRTILLSSAILTWLTIPGAVGATAAVTTGNVHVRANAVQENAKNDSQSISVITKADINEIRAKSAEDVVFRQTGNGRCHGECGRIHSRRGTAAYVDRRGRTTGNGIFIKIQRRRGCVAAYGRGKY